MFCGRHDHTIDDKGRLSIPRVFRDELMDDEGKPPMLVNQRDHLALFPATKWAALEKRLVTASTLDPDAQRLRRFYASGSVPCPVDSQGRILVPAFLREHASLENKVIVAGVFEHVEIWNPAKFETSQSETMHELDHIQRMVDERARS